MWNVCACSRKWGQTMTYDPCEEVTISRHGQCSKGVQVRDVAQSAECGLCRKAREEKEREERKKEDPGKHVHFDDNVDEIP